MRNDTLNPTPPIAPQPTTAAQPTVWRSRPRLSTVTSQEAPVIATGLPSTYPAITPSVTGERDRLGEEPAVQADARIGQPNSGTMP